MCQNAFLLTWNSCVRGPGRMNRYFLSRVVWNENKIWAYWGNLAKSLPSEDCQLLLLLPVSSFGFCTFSNFAEYLSVSNLHSGAIFFFFCIYLETKESKLLPSFPSFPQKAGSPLCLLNGMWISLAVKIGYKWWSPLSCVMGRVYCGY